MSWVNIALLSTAVFGAVNILDSHLLSKRMPSLRAFILPIGIIYLIYSLVLFRLFPLPGDIGVGVLLAAVASGMLRTASVTIMLYTLKREEVSRVVPVVYTYPIFVAIMAVPLLGESLHYLGWLAIIIVVMGAVILSSRQSQSGSTNRLSKSLFLLFGASLLLAMADITSKYVLGYISFWNLFWVSALCMSTIFLLFSMRPHVLKQLINMEQRNTALAIMGLNELLAPVAIILSLWAIERGPVSLVSTIVSSRPIFVVIFALILSRIAPTFLDWQPGRGLLALRLIAIAMIVSGITIIYLL